jgi:tricarballylate dehydrogenase
VIRSRFCFVSPAEVSPAPHPAPMVASPVRVVEQGGARQLQAGPLCVEEVLACRRLGRVGVARLDRREDGLVLGVRRHAAALDAHRRAAEQRHRAPQAQQGTLEIAVARRPVEERVELPVELGQPARVIGERNLRGDELPDFIDLDVRRVPGDQARRHALQHAAEIIELHRRLMVERRDDRTRARHDRDQAFRLQPADRLAHRRAADTELARQLRLAQPRPRQQFSRLDRGFELLVSVLASGHAATFLPLRNLREFCPPVSSRQSRLDLTTRAALCTVVYLFGARAAEPASLSGTRPDLTTPRDVLVIGAGNAAMSAAIQAGRAGARVLVVEAAPKAMRGGNTRHTRNCRLAHDAANETLTGPYPVEEFWDDLMRVTGGETDQELARFTLEESKTLWDWMTDQGIRFQPSLGGTLSLGRTNAFFLGGGRALVNALHLTAERLGIDVLYEAEVVDIEIEDGVFRAADVRYDGAVHRVEARALVAASGGFEANIEWLKEAWGPAAENFLIRGTPYNRGDVLRMLLDKGVQSVGDPKQCHAVAIDGRAPKFDGGIVTRLDCVPFGIVVNANGERFYDEGEDFWPKRYAIWGRLVAAQPEQVGHVIIDSKSINLFMPSVFPPVQADTVHELATKLGLDPERVETTTRAFNAACRTGHFDHTVHDDCRTEGLDPPKSHWARPIDTPPFYGYALRPGITFTYLGVRVNREARMQMADGRPSANMYAAGEIMAGNVLGRGYLAGIGMTIGAVFGRVAGQEAATHVGN